MIISLFDETGLTVDPWVKGGYSAVLVDILHEQDIQSSRVIYISGDILEREQTIVEAFKGCKINLVAAFPPCTEFAVSGARHFAAKALRDPTYVDKALELVWVSIRIGNALGAPYFVENPVSRLETLWRPSDYWFHPCEFGGYLPEDDLHPLWPDYIPPRDAYPKRTGIWAGNGFVLPEKKPVPIFRAAMKSGFTPQMQTLGGKSQKTKTIRSATPRGFAMALYQHYKDKP